MGITLYDQNWFSHDCLIELEKFVAGEYGCAASSVQIAVQSCLELLGTRIDIIPVIMPVTSAPDTLSAVLRSGGHPLLLDIDEETLQMDAEQLKDAIDMLEEDKKIVPVVLFNRPFGAPISAVLQELVLDYPSLVDSRLLPHPDLREEDVPCVFNIFDLTPVCGSGGFIVHRFPKQTAQLKLVRSGAMGLGGALPEAMAQQALDSIKDHESRYKAYGEACESLSAIKEAVTPSEWPSPFWLKVPNARQVVATLSSYDIESVVGLYPLYKLEEVNRRYSENPEYPVAEKLENSFVCIPANVKAIERTKEIL